MKRCPHCDLEMERQEAEPDIGLPQEFYCGNCDIYVLDESEWGDDYDGD